MILFSQLNFRSRLKAWWKHYKFVHRYGANPERHKHLGVPKIEHIRETFNGEMFGWICEEEKSARERWAKECQELENQIWEGSSNPIAIPDGKTYLLINQSKFEVHQDEQHQIN